jgi:predicted phosphodiesterase
VRSFALGVLALCALGCFRPAEQRAEFDLQVGIASAGGVSFVVHDGLAAVRSAEPGAIRLWAQAPVLQLKASSSADAVTAWTVTVLNCMPGSKVTGEVFWKHLSSTEPTTCQLYVELPAGKTSSFRVGPDDGDQTGAFTFAVVGDIQDALDRVGEVYARMNEDPALRFVASTGDLTENGKAQQLDEMLASLKGLRVPLYSTVGNHELGGDPVDWQRRFGRASFHFGFRGARLSFLDSASAGIDPIVYDWLQAWLDASRDKVHLVLTHYPPFDPVGTRAGAFRSTAEAAKLTAMLVEGRVDATFHGHLHSFYAYAVGGIPSYISGGGGAIAETMDGIGRHYLRVTVEPKTGGHLVSIVRVD